jgi:hypothetical protein
MLDDVTGKSFLGTHYDLSSEHALLSSLPVVDTAPPGLVAGMMISQCVARIALGDFAFVRDFERSRFVLGAEKFDKVLAALPLFERRAKPVR